MVDLLDDLEVYYKCDETGGTRAEEIASLDILAVGAVPAVPGIINNGCDFATGGVELVRSSAPALVFGDEALTLNFWAQINAGTQFTTQNKVCKSTGASFEYQTRYRAGGILRWEWLVFDGSTATLARADNFGAVPQGSLMMVTCIHDPVADIISIAVNNGTPDSVAHSTGIDASTLDFNIGIGPNGNSIGIVDEVGLWRRVLSAADITDLYNGGAGQSFDNFTASVALPPDTTLGPLKASAQYKERSGG